MWLMSILGVFYSLRVNFVVFNIIDIWHCGLLPLFWTFPNTWGRIPYYRHNIVLRKVEYGKLVSAMKSIKSDASGHDGISLTMLKLCCPAILKYLLHIINLFTESADCSSAFTKSLIISLCKVFNACTVSDLRPISLLPALSKVFERIVHNELYSFLYVDSILSTHQSGFCRG